MKIWDLAISRQALEKMCKISYYPHVILIFLVRNTFDGVMVWTLFFTLPQFSRKLFLFFFGIGLTETIGEIMILHCSFWNIYIEIYLKIPTPLWNLMEAAQRMGVSPRAGLIKERLLMKNFLWRSLTELWWETSQGKLGTL